MGALLVLLVAVALRWCAGVLLWRVPACRACVLEGMRR